MTIAVLTLVALVALVIEYFTRVFSRAFASARGPGSLGHPIAAGSAGASDECATDTGSEQSALDEWMPWTNSSPDPSLSATGEDEQPSTSASPQFRIAPAAPSPTTVVDAGFLSQPSRRELLPVLEPQRVGFQEPTVSRIEEECDPRAYMPAAMAIAHVAPAPAPAPAPRPMPVAAPAPKPIAKPTPALAPTPAPAPAPTTPESRAALELTLTVARLQAVADELARDSSLATASAAVDALREQAVAYDLDNLMAIADDTHIREAIACSRDALAIANQTELLRRRVAMMPPSEHKTSQLALELTALHAKVATAVALGTSLAQRLIAASADPVASLS